MPENEEIDLTPDEEKGWLGKIKDGIYENWQTILVALVVLIVGISAYNYNEKTGINNSNQATEQTSESSQKTEETPADADQEQNTEKKDEAAAQQQDQQNQQAAIENKDAAKQTNPTETNKEENKTASEQTKTETKTTNPATANPVTIEGDNYKTVAAKGDGLTHLARKALNKYLEENKDEEITDLHKIYIEDYLRKQLVSGKGEIKVGHEETFSKNTIEKAIASSKKLSQKSLDNLKKYSTVQ